MDNIFPVVQKNFMELSLFLSGLDLYKDLQKQHVLEDVYASLLKAYTLFDEGLCEAVPVCNKCNKNKDQLQKLVGIIDKCVADEKITDEAFAALHEFLDIIPQVLFEMKMIYLGSLSKTS